MFRAAHRSSSGALTVFAASGLRTHMVTGRSLKSEWELASSHSDLTTVHGSMNIKSKEYISLLT
jgi:hypothetical protein